ncbi:mitochondrial 39-S ribosomal protein L47 (MRP-L47)-domain-containing protein [Mycena crocata]|nr:mitochondrial 39-S ribosomal protein L47 (MRP-L47)-domain-containing protein [Mycena crocata]
MFSSILRAGRWRCLRHFSTTLPSASSAGPLLLGAPTGHRPSNVDDAGPSSDPTGPGSATTEAARPPFVPPTAQLSSDHGLYGFFRRKADPNLKGDDQYETFLDAEQAPRGRSWEASELRLKSFKDLHTLWYVLLRELNLLATQREEMRRMGVLNEQVTNRAQSARCRKSMARIKGVMNERRLAYEGAVALAEKEREEATDAAVLKFKLSTEQARRNATEHARTQRAGVKLQQKREAREAMLSAEGTKKARWTRAQKLANTRYKQRKTETRPPLQVA